ncbi:hypothetical protein WDW86_10515 [Bdellovibrionota bacterium FG-2]
MRHVKQTQLTLRPQQNPFDFYYALCHGAPVKTPTALLTILALFTTLASASESKPQCSTLELIGVKPVGLGKNHRFTCSDDDRARDAVGCNIKEGFGRFQKRNSDYLLTRDPESQNSPYLARLQFSKAISEINQYRIMAREVADAANPCEPTLIYFGKKEIFNLGPAFVDSETFSLDGQPSTNFITGEDVSDALLPVSIISQEALVRNSYFDITYVHEISHGIMQDLYGVGDMSKLTAKSHSRAGHNASVITDPALAWVEGFAEGFEAYMGERTLSDAQLTTPRIDKFVKEIAKSADHKVLNRSALAAAAFALPLAPIAGGYLATQMYGMAENILNISDLAIDLFLKLGRQTLLREGHPILQGQMSEFTHTYGMFLYSVNDAERVMDKISEWAPEEQEAMIHKEGVIAYYVYNLLKAGLHLEMFAAIHEEKPANFYAFLQALLSRVPPSKLESISPALKAIFTTSGHKQVARYLKNMIQLRKDKGKDTPANYKKMVASMANLNTAMLNALPTPDRVRAPNEIWIEFASDKTWIEKYRKKSVGRMNRVNIASMDEMQLRTFLASVSWDGIYDGGNRKVLDSDEKIEHVTDEIVSATLDARDSLKSGYSFEKFAERLEVAMGRNPNIHPAVAVITKMKFQEAKACFDQRCESASWERAKVSH